MQSLYISLRISPGRRFQLEGSFGGCNISLKGFQDEGRRQPDDKRPPGICFEDLEMSSMKKTSWTWFARLQASCLWRLS